MGVAREQGGEEAARWQHWGGQGPQRLTLQKEQQAKGGLHSAGFSNFGSPAAAQHSRRKKKRVSKQGWWGAVEGDEVGKAKEEEGRSERAPAVVGDKAGNNKKW